MLRATVTGLQGYNIGESQFYSREENFYLVQTDAGVKSESYPISRTLCHRAEIGRGFYRISSTCTVLKFRKRLAVTSLIPNLHDMMLWDKHTALCVVEIYVQVYYIYNCLKNTEIQMLVCQVVDRYLYVF
jgi:hypothetical protein